MTPTEDLQKRLARIAEKAIERQRRGQRMIDFTEPRTQDDDDGFELAS